MSGLAQPAQVVSHGKFRSAISLEALQLIAQAADACALLLASVLGFAIYQFLTIGELDGKLSGFGIGLQASIVFVLLARSSNSYELRSIIDRRGNYRRGAVSLAWSLLLVTCTLFSFKLGEQYSRGSIATFGLTALCFIIFNREVLSTLAINGVNHGVVTGKRIVTIGLAHELATFSPIEVREFGLEEVARITVYQQDVLDRLAPNSVAQIAQAIEIARKLNATEFVLAIPWTQANLLTEVSSLLQVSPLGVRLLPDQGVRNFLDSRQDRKSQALFSVEVQRQPLNSYEKFAKRALDLCLASAILVMVAPLLALVALAVKLDSRGPVLFRQRRCGFGNREFVIFKFRTMTTLDDGDTVVQASRTDQRVTRIGRILRRSSIDELPQLLNVVLGEMSLVGPRPHALAHHNYYNGIVASYALRHHVKPGITGMAQVTGFRGETTNLRYMEKRVEQDLWYINNWSLALDLMIMGKTCVELFRQDVY